MSCVVEAFVDLGSGTQLTGKAYFRGTKRIVPLQVLGVNGAVAARAFGTADVVVLNDSTRHEYELSSEGVSLVRQRWLS
jgi:hypothetical protein